MHKNIIFDCGRVLILWSPEILSKVYTDNEEDRKLFLDIVFKYWSTIIDSGDFKDEDLSKIVSPFLPDRLLPKVDELTKTWYKNIPDVEGMLEVVKALKKNHKIYLLSNIQKDFDKHFNEREILSYFDGYVLSGNVHMLKPYKGIYEHILTKYNLDPKESLFVDDTDYNLLQAEKFGIDTFKFDPNKVSEFVKYLQDNKDL